MKNSMLISLIYFFIALNSNIHAQHESISDIFPLEIGNRWYNQAGSNRNECYGIIKEVTDTLSNGFKEITCKNLFRTGVSITKEYWCFIDGKFYSNSSPQIQNAQVFYNAFLTHDSCMGDINYSYCLKLIELHIFNIIDSAQIYIRNWALASIVSGTQKVITSTQIGITSTWAASYPRSGEGIRDSTSLIGMYRNGEFLGDSIFYNPYRASSPIFPENNYYFEYPNVKFMWQIASEVISYRLQVSKESLFNDVIVDSAGMKDTFLVVGPLTGHTKYYWRVGTLSSDGKEYWSSIFNFSLILREDKVEPITTFSLYQNYPNPFSQNTKIKYSLTSGSTNTSAVILWPVQIKIFNILGEEVATYASKWQPDGIYEIEFMSRDLVNGIYIYRVQAGGYIESKKMILLK
jgi:hypothetical protein